MDMMNVPLLSSKLQELLMRTIIEHFVLPKVLMAPDWRPEMIAYMKDMGIPDLPDGWFSRYPALAAELIQAATTSVPPPPSTPNSSSDRPAEES